MSAVDPSQFNGIVCTLDEWSRSNLSDPDIHCLTRGETVGLTLNVVAASMSLVAIVGMFCRIAWNIYRSPPGKRRLIQEPMDIYMLSLFWANFFQALGTVLGAKWVNDGKTQSGPLCTTQGIIQQLGETNVSLATLVIAVHSFVVVWWGKGTHSLPIASATVGVCWLFVILYIIIGESIHHAQKYEAPSPYWCWIGQDYLKEKISGEYLWFWLCLVVSAVVYIPLHLWSRGNLTIVDDRKWFSFRIHRAVPAEVDTAKTRGKRRSFAMLAYPLVYCVAVLPLSVVRWIGFVNDNRISYQATFAVNFIFELSGLFDVLLFLYARPGLLLFSERDPGTQANDRGRAPSLSGSSTSGMKDRSGDLQMRQADWAGDRGMGRLPQEDVGDWDIEESSLRASLQSQDRESA
ncbi:hypothetical protein PLICRDRAFT_46572 [Plicaturopsis crispa FD-325 SS-3]|uniref:Glucose receptor Git3 N-terminal domain-containing protein n=1 Tax=Plicaturopsis crispa FD-325 SS-3 TaxID=944288 RepID=A0A0C9SR06_PLICR|nr:hypothetical protein PLICRDRAFT_46572 [Plicaturopsis crispa FD-325 SS-3]